jgi:hypothetical protein
MQQSKARKDTNGGRQMQKAKQKSTHFVASCSVVVPKNTPFPCFSKFFQIIKKPGTYSTVAKKCGGKTLFLQKHFFEIFHHILQKKKAFF